MYKCMTPLTDDVPKIIVNVDKKEETLVALLWNYSRFSSLQYTFVEVY